MRKNIWKDIAIALLCVAVFGGVSFAIVWMAFPSATQSFMNSARSFQAIATVTLICVGGVFAYRRLQLFRTFEPHLTITHEISHRYIGDSYVHIDVTATLHNGSKVQVELRDGFFRLQQVSPATDEAIENLYAEVFTAKSEYQLQWTVLDEIQREWESGELIVEPGASHPEKFEFIVSRNIKTVIIYSYFFNPQFARSSNSAEGWIATTAYDMVNHH